MEHAQEIHQNQLKNLPKIIYSQERSKWTQLEAPKAENKYCLKAG